MSIVPDDDGHVRGAIGLYLLGGLSDDEAALIERHLGQCDSCLHEYNEHSDVPIQLSSLDERAVDEIDAPASGRGPAQADGTGSGEALPNSIPRVS